MDAARFAEESPEPGDEHLAHTPHVGELAR
jgi:hypothetical protein